MPASEERRIAILLAGQGDHGAFSALVAPRRERLLLLLAAVLGDWHEAEDAAQETLWRAYRELHRLRDAGAFDAWLRALAVNVARDRLRAIVSRRRREGVPSGAPADMERLRSPAQETPGADPDAVARLLDRIASLPHGQRRAAGLVWVAGVPAEEAAAVLGTSVGGVRASLYRARRHLAGVLGPDGTWRRDGVGMAAGEVAFAGSPSEVEPLLAHWATVRPELRVRPVPAHDPGAHVHFAVSVGEPLERRAGPPDPSLALPLDGLADAAGLDLEPFGDRLARFSHGGRPYWLPRTTRPHVVTYNADLLEKAGLPLPPADWSWDAFFGYCRRCASAGISPHSPWTPNGMDAGIVAEQLGATESNLEPVREAADFVRRWRAQGLAHPEPRDRNALLSFFEGRTAFLLMQQGASVPDRFAEYGCRPFRWGLAPHPRFRRSDRHVPYWFYHSVGVTAAAADPVAAFRVAAALFTDGPEAPPDSVPAYRTPQTMRAWRAHVLPLGQDCLLELDAQTPPLWTPPWLFLLPGEGDTLWAGSEALWDLAFSETTVEQGIAALRAAAARHHPATPLPLRD